MTKKDRPFVSWTVSLGFGSTKRMVREFATYRELRSNLKTILKDSIDLEASVTRYKRGQWGEWFENWKYNSGKPIIVKEGWM